MSARKLFLQREAADIANTAKLIAALLREESLSEYQVIALGTLLQNAYSGVERILRFFMQEKGIKLAKSEDWHKRLLAASHQAGLSPTRSTLSLRNCSRFATCTCMATPSDSKWPACANWLPQSPTSAADS